MSIPPRRPVLVGAGQFVQRVEDPQQAGGPLEVMEQALRTAAEDAGAPGLLRELDAIYTPQGLWRYGDPGRVLAERLGAGAVETGIGIVSGHIVQVLFDRACEAIARGQHDIVAIVGGESENSKRRLARSGLPPAWDEAMPGEPDLRFGEYGKGRLRQEVEAGINDAVSCFALCDVSLRHSRGETPGQHRDRIAALYEGLSRIAARNPHAWLHEPRSAEEIRNPGSGNRMVSFPYTKLMTSNISVDQGAALILCSEEAARRLGIASDRRVYLRAATEMNETSPLSDREHLHHHPGQILAAERALEHAGVSPAEIAYADVYSCFPFAVQVGAEALGLPLDPIPSLTGGMTFFGGPFGNYVLHSMARMVECVRAEPGSFAAIGSVGGFFSHFAFGIYSTDPGDADGPVLDDVTAAMADRKRRPWLADFDGRARVESYTVSVDNDGPRHATFTALTPAGERVWGRSEDPTLLEALLAEEDACGRASKIRAGTLELG